MTITQHVGASPDPQSPDPQSPDPQSPDPQSPDPQSLAEPRSAIDWNLVSAGPPTSERQAPSHTAIIDVGSGSARAVVMQVNPGGGIEIIAQQRINLNLISHINSDGALDDSGVAGAVDALEDFALLARAYGVRSIHAVGTEALRASGNATAIIDAAVERFGIPLRIIDGSDEAAYCFLGAIHGLPVSDGILADIGGGSMEIVRFNGRAMNWSASLPLGSLRIANQFGLTDLARPADARAAYERVHAMLIEAGAPRLEPGEALVGSGGSVRLISRLLRSREPYPIIKMHGYQMEISALAAMSRELSTASLHQRSRIAGMNPQRANSIAGGAIAAHALSQHVGADSITVSGQGLREGLARVAAQLPADRSVAAPPLDAIRPASLADLAARFAPRFSQRGARRALLARSLSHTLWEPRDRRVGDALECAAFLWDIGNAIDYYNRSNRAASVIVRTDLPGFAHQDSALIAAILLASERSELPRRFRDSRLLSDSDIKLVGQAGVALILISELDNRLEPSHQASQVRFARRNGMFEVATPSWSDAAAASVRQRWREEFGERIEFVRWES